VPLVDELAPSRTLSPGVLGLQLRPARGTADAPNVGLRGGMTARVVLIAKSRARFRLESGIQQPCMTR
jgi:hypothetical protein